MKKTTTLISAVSIFTVALVILFSCEKDKAPKPPTGNTNKIIFTVINTDSVSYRSASFSCSINTLGGQNIQQHGFCWDTQENPDITKNKTELGTMTNPGEFSSDLSSLQPNTKYYIKAYVTFDDFAIYSLQTMFTTNPIGTPSVITSEVANITAFSAQSGGNVTANDGSDVTARGVCWSTTQNPTISDSHTTDGTGMGGFTSELTELENNDTYYLRAYATNSAGTAYGSEKSFTTEDGLPEITTAEITNVTANSAQSGGNITDDGGSSITARGVCWSTTQNPIISDSHTANGSGLGSFISEVTELEFNTTYYLRAYATNVAGTTYGPEKSFTTEDGLPEIITAEIANITASSAQSGGNITDNGGFSITARGVCWSTSQNPTISNSHTTDGTGMGGFTSDITGLTTGVKYYVRAYATNSTGTAFGNQLSFTTFWLCGSQITYMDQNYNTVLIGDQCWMAENLNVGTRINGSQNMSDNGTIEKYCYDDNEAYCNEYGGLYQWDEMMQYAINLDVQGICPDGWRLPTDDEWIILEGTVDSQYGVSSSEWDGQGWRGYDAGKNLKSTSGWYSNGNGTDTFGYSVLPGGCRYSNGYLSYLTFSAYFWSSGEYNSDGAWGRHLYYFGDEVYRYNYSKSYGFSVRCLKD
jgi:uncharacterized protein (TIGR02145 family)